MNFCGHFTGQVNVYGREKEEGATEVLHLIEESLNPSDPTKLHPEIVEMTSADEFLEIEQLDLCCRMLTRLGQRLTA